MFIGRWVERVAHLVAPDETYESSRAAEDPVLQSVLEVVAPDPNFTPPSSGNHSLLLHTPREDSAAGSHSMRMVQCEHCHQMTRVVNTSVLLKTPNSSNNTTERDVDRMHKARQQTERLKSPPFTKQREELKELFDMIKEPAYYKPQRNPAKLRKLIQRHPEWLTAAEARTSEHTNQCPEGYTPLMVAAHVNHMPVAEILLETFAQEQLQACNGAGKTALHIASAQGHADMVQLLVKTMKTLDLPLDPPDILGRTPLGLGLQSPEAKALTNRRVLMDTLFSPTDASIVGTPVPHDERFVVSPSLTMAMARADMPGMRIDMEDCLLMEVLCQSDNKAVCGVFDGHGDGGKCSEFVAGQLWHVLNHHQVDVEWDANVLRQAFVDVDDELAKTKIVGGSTAVVAVLTKDKIIVANAGDSRCILVQTGGGDLVETMQHLALSSVGDASTSVTVTALSNDHKPDLASEKERIENAGLEVVEDGGIAKISVAAEFASNMLATSRGFGDFEFKNVKGLDDDKQAVIPDPDLIVHERAENDCFLILACDGIWDVMSNQEVGQFVLDKVNEGLAADDDYVLTKTADQLLRNCLDRKSGDNMSVIIVALNEMAKKVDQSLPKTRLDFAGSS